MDRSKVEAIRMNDLTLKRVPYGVGGSTRNLEAFFSKSGNVEFIKRGTFKDMKKLNHVVISQHKMKFLPEEVFWDLNDLALLAFHENQLEKLPKNVFSKSVNLKRINLNDNRFSHLDGDLFKNNLLLDSV